MTTRNLTASVGSLMSEPSWGFRVLAHISCSSSTIYAQSGVGTLRVGTIDYLGIGHLGRVERVADDLEDFSPGVKLSCMTQSYTLPNSANLLLDTLNENLFNKDVLLYRAFLREGALVNTPELWFRGKVNEINLTRGDPERGDVVELECRIRLKKENKSSYYTREDLWLTYSGDTGFNYHSQIVGFKGLWGQQPTFFDRGVGGGRPDRGRGSAGPGGAGTTPGTGGSSAGGGGHRGR